MADLSSTRVKLESELKDANAETVQAANWSSSFSANVEFVRCIAPNPHHGYQVRQELEDALDARNRLQQDVDQNHTELQWAQDSKASLQAQFDMLETELTAAREANPRLSRP